MTAKGAVGLLIRAMSIELESIAFHEGQYRPLRECNVNISTHALQYGTMVFGGMRGYFNAEHGRLYIFRLRDHLERLTKSARIMQMKPPLSVEEMQEVATKDLQDRFGLDARTARKYVTLLAEQPGWEPRAVKGGRGRPQTAAGRVE